MPRYCLDTSALLTLRDDEPGADRVALVLEQPAAATGSSSIHSGRVGFRLLEFPGNPEFPSHEPSLWRCDRRNRSQLPCLWA